MLSLRYKECFVSINQPFHLWAPDELRSLSGFFETIGGSFELSLQPRKNKY